MLLLSPLPALRSSLAKKGTLGDLCGEGVLTFGADVLRGQINAVSIRVYKITQTVFDGKLSPAHRKLTSKRRLSPKTFLKRLRRTPSSRNPKP